MKENIQPVMIGTLNVQRLYDTMALIISKRENVRVTVKVAKIQP